MNLVEVKDFSFSYPECSHKVLEHVNLKIKEGTLNVICGRSGCGKSTLLRQLKTVLAPLAMDVDCGVCSVTAMARSLVARRALGSVHDACF